MGVLLLSSLIARLVSAPAVASEPESDSGNTTATVAASHPDQMSESNARFARKVIRKHERQLALNLKRGRNGRAVGNMRILGGVHDELGERELAERYFRGAVELARSGIAAPNREFPIALSSLAAFLITSGRGDEGLAVRLEEVEVLSKWYGPSSPDYALAASALGTELVDAGAVGEGVSFARQALKVLDGAGVLAPEDTSDVLFAAGHALLTAGQTDEAAQVFARLLGLSRGAKDQAGIVSSLHALALAEGHRGNFGGMTGMLEEMLERNRTIWGQRSAQVADTLDLLASVDSLLGNHRVAAEHWSEVVEIRQALSGESDAGTIEARSRWAIELQWSGDYARAIHALAPALAQTLRLGNDDERATDMLLTRSLCLEHLGELEAARADTESRLSRLRASPGPDAESLALALNQAARLHENLGDFGAGISYRQQALVAWTAIRGAGSAEAAIALVSLGRSRSLNEDYSGAAVDLEAALIEQEGLFGPVGEPLVATLVELSDVLARAGDVDQALYSRARAVEILSERYGASSPQVVAVGAEAVLANIRAGRGDDAVTAARQLLGRVESGDPNIESQAAALTLLGRALGNAGRFDEAVANLGKASELAGDAPSVAGFFAHLERAVVERGADRPDMAGRERVAALAMISAVVPWGAADIALGARAADASAAGDAETVTWVHEALVRVARQSANQRRIASETDNWVVALATLGANLAVRDPPQTPRAIETLQLARSIDRENGNQQAVLIGSFLGFAYRAVGDPARGATEFRDVISAISDTDGNDSRKLLAPLLDLQICQHDLGDKLGAIETTRRMLAIRERVFGHVSSETLDALETLAGMLEDAGRHAESAALFPEVLEVQAGVHADDKKERTQLLGMFAWAAQQAGDTSLALSITQERLAIAMADITSSDHIDELKLRDELAFDRWMLGDEAGMILEERQALSIADAAFGRDDARTVSRIAGVANDLVARVGQPTTAIALLNEFESPRKPAAAEGGGRVLLILSRASALAAMGRAAESLECIDRAWLLADASEDSFDQPRVLLAAAKWQMELGSPAEALRLATEAGAIVLPAGYDEELWDTQTLPLRVDAALAAGDLVLARIGLDRIESIDATLAEGRADNRASAQGRYLVARAEAKYRELVDDRAGALDQWTTVTELCRSVMPAGARSCLEDRQSVAAAHARSGDYAGAVLLAQETVATANTWMRPGDPLTAALRMDLAYYLSVGGAGGEARALIREAAIDRTAVLHELMVSASDEDRLAAAAFFRPTEDMYLSFFDHDEDAEEAYAVVLASKGLSAASTLTLETAWRDSSDPRATEIARQLSETTAAMTTARLAGAEEAPGLSAKAKRLERQLTRLGKNSAPVVQSSPTLKSVCAAVPRGSTFVDYVRYQHRRPGSTQEGPAYAAFVIEPEACAVRRVDLGAAAPIDEAARAFGISLAAGRGGVPAAMEHGGRLRELIWEPLVGSIGADQVVIAPDGALGVVPFAALPDANGRFLVEERRIGVVESAFDLLRSDRSSQVAVAGALVVGGVSYGVPESDSVTRRGCGPAAGFSPLAATGNEADAVSTLLTGMGVDGIVSLRGADATENAVRAALPHASFVHFATHGFTRQCAGAGGAPAGPVGARVSAGLAFAGVNSRGDAPAENDGLLMAEEVAQLDLRSVRVAVLSACETGLGDVQDGDGVIGLRRAFATAGAETLVVSLWAVDDKPTQALMTLFYSAMAREGITPSDAFREAQLALLDKNRREFNEARPYTWAAFEPIGGIR